MRRFAVTLLMFTLVALGLVGCGSNNGNLTSAGSGSSAPAASSPTLCPATPPAFSGAAESPPNSSSAVETAAATSSGWATAVSRMLSASASVP